MYRIDLNSDLGESFGAYTTGNDEGILQYATSVNAACGFHAGDPVVMEKTVALAKEKGVMVGAHPGYPDLQGFGRRQMGLTPAEARASVIYQIGALEAFLRVEDIPLQHVKLHGALYNTAAKDMKLSEAICEGIKRIAPDCILLGLAGSKMLEAAKACGLRYASEVFADRAYNDDGTLVARSLPGAVLHDEDIMVARVIRMVREGTVESINGKTVEIRADSVCVHGDNPSALAFVRRIREEMQAQGIEVKALSARD